jgi:hypothetical protein
MIFSELGPGDLFVAQAYYSPASDANAIPAREASLVRLSPNGSVGTASRPRARITPDISYYRD